MSSQPPSGFIHLVLLSQEAPFYLEIPIAIVATVCLSPRKYLRYLGWCVLGVVGVLTDEQENEIVLDGELLDQGVYRYLVPDQNVLAHAVDLEVIKQRSQVPSESTRTREDFCTKVLKRDGCCVWTGGDGVGMHIIPYARGDEVCSHYSYPAIGELISVHCSSGSNVSLTTGHMPKISSHSVASTIFGTAFVLRILFITDTLTHERSLFSRFVRSFLQSDHH